MSGKPTFRPPMETKEFEIQNTDAVIRSVPSCVSEAPTEKWSNAEREELRSGRPFSSCGTTSLTVDGIECLALSPLGSERSPEQQVKGTLLTAYASMEKTGANSDGEGSLNQSGIAAVILEGPPPSYHMSWDDVGEKTDDMECFHNQRWYVDLSTLHDGNSSDMPLSLPVVPEDVDDWMVSEDLSLSDEEYLSKMHVLVAQLVSQMRFHDALRVFDVVIKEHKKRGVELHMVGSTLHNIGVIRMWEGRYDKAKVSFWGATRIRKELYGTNHPDVAVSLVKMGIAHYALGEFDKAKNDFREALNVRRKVLAQDHLEIGKILNNLGCALFQANDISRAFGSFNESLSIFRRCTNQSSKESMHSFNAATTLSNLSVVYFLRKKRSLGVSVLEESLTIQKAVLDTDHMKVLLTLESLAFAYSSVNKNQRTIELYDELLCLQAAKFGSDHQYCIATLSKLSLLNLQMSHFGAAQQCLARVLEYQEKNLPDDNGDLNATRSAMANIEQLIDASGADAPILSKPKDTELEKALAMHEEELEKQMSTYGPNHPNCAKTLNRMAKVHLRLGNHASALQCMKRVLAYQKKVLPEDHPELLKLRRSIKKLKRVVSDENESMNCRSVSDDTEYKSKLKAYEEKLLSQKAQYGINHPSCAKTLSKMTHIHILAGNYDAAADCMETVLSYQKGALAEGDKELENSFGLMHKIEQLRSTSYLGKTQKMSLLSM